ncbi:MAG: hypothetical protein LBU84_19405 [Prevotella sp.]|jgi:hypothetical protein|nr:hypothetical protein [Prevotella sp.]
MGSSAKKKIIQLTCIIRKILNIKKKIYITIPAYYPVWHSLSTDYTDFAKKIIKGRKIHIIKTDIAYWLKMNDKFTSDEYKLLITYGLYDLYTGSRRYFCIKSCKILYVQRASILLGYDYILVNGKKIPSGIIARNEGMSTPDFIEWIKGLDVKEFCIVNFTNFSY